MKKAEPKQLEHRRQHIVYEALKNLLSDEEIEQALGLLQSNFDGYAPFSIIEYVKQLDHLLKLGEKKQQIRRLITWSTLINDRNLNEAALERVRKNFFAAEPPIASPNNGDSFPILHYPTSQNASSRLPVANKGSQHQDRITFRNLALKIENRGNFLFNYILQRILSEIKNSNNKNELELKQFLRNESPTMLIHKQVKLQLIEWCQDKTPEILTDHLKSMAEILHNIYIWLCNRFGPTDADRIYAGVFYEVKKLPQSRNFPLDKLL